MSSETYSCRHSKRPNHALSELGFRLNIQHSASTCGVDEIEVNAMADPASFPIINYLDATPLPPTPEPDSTMTMAVCSLVVLKLPS